MYEAIKINGKWCIQALSICFKPIICRGMEYRFKAAAVNAACDLSGYYHKNPREKQYYLDYLAAFKARIIKENYGIMPTV